MDSKQKLKENLQVLRAQLGDDSAFEALYHYWEMVYEICGAQTKSQPRIGLA